MKNSVVSTSISTNSPQYQLQYPILTSGPAFAVVLMPIEMAKGWLIRVPRCLRCLICVRKSFKVASAPKLSDFVHSTPSSQPVPHVSSGGQVVPDGRISEKSRAGEDRDSSVSMTCMTVEHKANRPLGEYVFPRTLGQEEDEEREVRMTA